jgi:hypothetical protein
LPTLFSFEATENSPERRAPTEPLGVVIVPILVRCSGGCRHARIAESKGWGAGYYPRPGVVEPTRPWRIPFYWTAIPARGRRWEEACRRPCWRGNVSSPRRYPELKLNCAGSTCPRVCSGRRRNSLKHSAALPSWAQTAAVTADRGERTRLRSMVGVQSCRTWARHLPCPSISSEATSAAHRSRPHPIQIDLATRKPVKLRRKQRLDSVAMRRVGGSPADTPRCRRAGSPCRAVDICPSRTVAGRAYIAAVNATATRRPPGEIHKEVRANRGATSAVCTRERGAGGAATRSSSSIRARHAPVDRIAVAVGERVEDPDARRILHRRPRFGRFARFARGGRRDRHLAGDHQMESALDRRRRHRWLLRIAGRLHHSGPDLVESLDAVRRATRGSPEIRDRVDKEAAAILNRSSSKVSVGRRDRHELPPRGYRRATDGSRPGPSCRGCGIRAGPSNSSCVQVGANTEIANGKDLKWAGAPSETHCKRFIFGRA